MPLEDNRSTFSFISDFDGEMEDIINQELDPVMPILPLRNMLIFPGVMMPVSVGRRKSLSLVKEAAEKGALIAVVCQKNPSTESPSYRDIHDHGVAARIIRVLDLPDGNTSVILQGLCHVRVRTMVSVFPYLTGEVIKVRDMYPRKKSLEFNMMMTECRKRAEQMVHELDSLPSESAFAIKNISNDYFLINFLCGNFPFSIEEKLTLLRNRRIDERLVNLMQLMDRELKLAAINNQIREKTQAELNRQQRDYFLQQQIRNIQEELGGQNGTDKDVTKLRALAAEVNMPEHVSEIFEEELLKLERYNPQSPDYATQYSYLHTIATLPWNTYTTDNLSIKNAQRVLNRDHYGMDKVKERILEHLAVLQLRRDLKSPILCLYGPPGVGKTSLGRSIAEAMGRKYVRVSLGGLHDESEIRGHRRTYIGAMPGRIIKNIKKVGSSNPVFILDEIDKVTEHTVQGDPSSAMLEVLDPEQNNAFHDNYLDIDYDLSNVMFIATANNIASIPKPLLDRMELIEVSGYIAEEKVEIAKRHLIPKAMKETGMEPGPIIPKITVSKAAITYIIEHYTRESGVRSLEKQINKLFRKMALCEALDAPYHLNVRPDDVRDLLGKPIYNRDTYQDDDIAGVVTGLAWTAVGGEILYIETSLSRGNGKLTLTGNLGDVMKESAVLALEYIKAHAQVLGIDHRIFEHWNIHVHVPEGAVPKDGPSAGITMATSIASALTQRRVRSHIAMTGEITLRGRVLPVGGIKEKILAAKRAGITDILICDENRKDIEEIACIYVKDLKFHYVKTVMDVWKYALMKNKVSNPIDLTIPADKDKEDDKK